MFYELVACPPPFHLMDVSEGKGLSVADPVHMAPGTVAH
jgi:hypothetical protein